MVPPGCSNSVMERMGFQIHTAKEGQLSDPLPLRRAQTAAGCILRKFPEGQKRDCFRDGRVRTEDSPAAGG